MWLCCDYAVDLAHETHFSNCLLFQKPIRSHILVRPLPLIKAYDSTVTTRRLVATVKSSTLDCPKEQTTSMPPYENHPHHSCGNVISPIESRKLPPWYHTRAPHRGQILRLYFAGNLASLPNVHINESFLGLFSTVLSSSSRYTI